jgi:ketosteroid isomerase-like protein
MGQGDVHAAERLYAAMRAKDPRAILEALGDDFVGEVNAGMPLGVGGRHDGPRAMLRDVWGPVFAAYNAVPEVEELVPAGEDRVVALGHYRGDGFTAAFAHVLTVRDGRVTRLRQFTDTRSWPGPAARA